MILLRQGEKMAFCNEFIIFLVFSCLVKGFIQGPKRGKFIIEARLVIP